MRVHPRLFQQSLWSHPPQEAIAVVVQSLSCVRLFATPWNAAHQAFLSFTISRSLLKIMSIESMMPSNHLILCHPLLLLPSIFPSTRVFSSESALPIRWPKYWSFSFSISPSSEFRVDFFRMDWLDLLAVQGTLKSLLQHTVREHQLFSAQPSLWSSGHRHLSHLLNLSHQVPHSLSTQSNASSARGVGNTRTSAVTQCLALSVWHCQTSWLARRHQGHRGLGFGREAHCEWGWKHLPEPLPRQSPVHSFTSPEKPSVTASPTSPPARSTLYLLHSSRDLSHLQKAYVCLPDLNGIS